MKFDSYTRFLKSLLYQECMLAEVEGRPLPDPYHIPSSPTSKHSTTGSDRSNLSTPKKVTQSLSKHFHLAMSCHSFHSISIRIKVTVKRDKIKMVYEFNRMIITELLFRIYNK